MPQPMTNVMLRIPTKDIVSLGKFVTSVLPLQVLRLKYQEEGKCIYEV